VIGGAASSDLLVEKSKRTSEPKTHLAGGVVVHDREGQDVVSIMNGKLEALLPDWIQRLVSGVSRVEE
jgi:hypothetical protein